MCRLTVFTIVSIIASGTPAGESSYFIRTRATVLTWIGGAVVHVYNNNIDIFKNKINYT